MPPSNCRLKMRCMWSLKCAELPLLWTGKSGMCHCFLLFKNLVLFKCLTMSEWEKIDVLSRCISLGSSGAAAPSGASTGESCFITHFVLICWELTLLDWISLSVRLQNYLVITCYLFRLILGGHSFHYVAVQIGCVQLGGESGFELNCFPLPKFREHIGNLLFPGTDVRYCCKVHTAVCPSSIKNESLFTPFEVLVHFWKCINLLFYSSYLSKKTEWRM